MSGEYRELDSLRLVVLCASDTQNAALWSEFVRRFAPKIRMFIRGTLWQSSGSVGALPDAPMFASGVQENDLFQNTIIRLVENDCAALKRFTGTSEGDFLAYLAVISRSAVRDHLRHRNIRSSPISLVPGLNDKSPAKYAPAELQQLEKRVLAREVMRLSQRSIRSLSGESGGRDWLIFQLYYVDGLSIDQITRCNGIELSKAGVEKVLNRLKKRLQSLVSTDRSEAVIR
ncbi:MAG TPA: sigma-70 family RNA polymerase sigma factor [Acidobacteriota bacterium]|nr:sigma-70 family RNA polymerase sigma factor [Acidobacteriota bacterium]